ncbi:unnamed protein product [Rotaria socialis]
MAKVPVDSIRLFRINRNSIRFGFSGLFKIVIRSDSAQNTKKINSIQFDSTQIGFTKYGIHYYIPSLTREELQEIILKQNPNWTVQSNTINPDADVHLTEDQLGDFQPPRCPRCSGRIKPDVTFFGDNVDRRLVDFLKEQLSKSDSVLVAGSSLEVMSSYRFILAAQQLKMPIAIINIGRTRGDHAAQLKISTRCGLILPHIEINS